MNLLKDTSISRKLKLVIMMTTSVTLLLACAAFVAYDLISVRRSMASDLSTLAKVIGANSTAALAFSDSDSAKDLLSGFTAKKNIASARLSLISGEVLAEYIRDSGYSPPTPTDRIQGTRFYQSYLVAAEPIILDGEVIGEICLISDLLDLRERIVQYVGVVASVLFASLLVAFVISSRLQRMISGPISHLARTAGAVSVGRDYTIRATRHGSDELGTLIDGFNEMLGQIQERDAKLQRARDELEQRVEERTKALQEEIAERSRIEDALRHSEEHFRSLIENGSDMISVVDLDGTIRYASPSVERVLGYKPDEMIGRILSEFTHPDDVSAASSLRARINEPGTMESRELRIRHKSGDWRTSSVRTTCAGAIRPRPDNNQLTRHHGAQKRGTGIKDIGRLSRDCLGGLPQSHAPYGRGGQRCLS